MIELPRTCIQHLYISPGHNFFGHHGQAAGTHPMLELPEITCLAGRGIVGDRFLDFKDDYKGQITFFAREVHDELCAEFGVRDREPGVFRRNVITYGVSLTDLYGREFEIQGVRFFGTGECAPCHWMNTAFHPGAENRLQGHGGLRAKIMSDGMLRVAATAGGNRNAHNA
ncbi:MAG: molybdenum cofactor biosysynthesis protein [Chthoniobacter sp.]|nr:molybdenum cofactor biosysynthesis protein [Chthoniobacter sp.]